MKRLWCLTACWGLLFWTSAHAEICYFASTSPPTASAVFSCPQAGQRTVSQLAAAGWQIRQLSPRFTPAGTAWQLVLQRGAELVFRSGFEA